MIIAHPLLNIDVTLEDIELVAEREGYDLFIPITFVKHLMAAFSWVRMGQTCWDSIESYDDYTNDFKDIMRSINFMDAKTDNPLEFAIRVLRIFCKRWNYRQIEIAAMSGNFITLGYDWHNNVQNYSFDLKSLSKIQLQTLGLEDKDLDIIELDEDTKKLLIFYEGLNVIEKPLDPEYDVVKKQITSYSDFYKGRHYKLALPTFPIDLGLKKLQITKIDDKEVLASEVIIMIDYSLSMSSVPFAKAMIRSVLLYYIEQLDINKNLTVTLVDVVGGITRITGFFGSTGLQFIFHHLPKFTLPIKHVKNIFKEVELKYAGKSVVFLTDGKINLNEPMHLKYKLYCVGLTYNEMLKQTCQLSGGQFIVLK